MAKFTKKPVEIEAHQLSRENGPDLAAMCGGQWLSLYGRGDRGEDISHVIIPTLEGKMRADLGDWIIRGVKGEFYPCKPDIFAMTHDDAALSHAAGQDGEQCRAASVASEEVKFAVYQLEQMAQGGPLAFDATAIRSAAQLLRRHRSEAMTHDNNALPELLSCAECGMPCAPGESHPYAACLMFRECRDSRVVRDNLDFVRRAGGREEAVELAAWRELGRCVFMGEPTWPNEWPQEVSTIGYSLAMRRQNTRHRRPAEGGVMKITDEMVDSYLRAQREAIEKEGFPNAGGRHRDAVRDACRAGIEAALSHAAGQEDWSGHSCKNEHPPLPTNTRPTRDAGQEVDKKVDWIAENHHDYWIVRVLCAETPRFYSIRKSDGQMLELPHKDSPFVPFPAVARSEGEES